MLTEIFVFATCVNIILEFKVLHCSKFGPVFFSEILVFSPALSLPVTLCMCDLIPTRFYEYICFVCIYYIEFIQMILLLFLLWFPFSFRISWNAIPVFTLQFVLYGILFTSTFIALLSAIQTGLLTSCGFCIKYMIKFHFSGRNLH